MKTEYRPIKPKVKESAILNACIRWLWSSGAFVWRNNTGGTHKSYERKDGSTAHYHIKFGYPGSADILGMNKHGRFLAIECKAANGKLSEQQERFREYVERHGGVYLVARSLDDLEANKQLILSSCPRGYAENSIYPNYIKPKAKMEVVE